MAKSGGVHLPVSAVVPYSVHFDFVNSKRVNVGLSPFIFCCPPTTGYGRTGNIWVICQLGRTGLSVPTAGR